MRESVESDNQRGPAWARTVDWREQDSRIAENVGRTRERVRQVRLKLGLPASPYHRMLKQSRLKPLVGPRKDLVLQGLARFPTRP